MNKAQAVSFLSIVLFAATAALARTLGIWALPDPPRWLVLLLLAFAFVPLLVDRLLPENRVILVRFPLLLIAVFSGLAAVLMWQFRQRLFLPAPNGNGDSHFLIEQIPVYAELFGARLSFDEILALFVHSKFYLLCNKFGVGIIDSYAILSCGAGILYTATALFYLNRRSLLSWLAGASVLLLTPAISIFFGYVEHYDAVSLILFVVAVMCLHLMDKDVSTPAWIAIGLLSALGALFHMMGGLALFPLLYFVWFKTGNRNDFIRAALKAGIPAITFLAFAWIYFLLLADNRINLRESFFVKPPIYPLREFFSGKHIFDSINLILLGMPFAGGALLYFLFHKEMFRTTISRPDVRFLLIGLAAFFTASLFINPLLSFPSDWDLFTMFQVFGNLTLAAIFAHIHSKENKLTAIALCALIICSTSTVLWIHRNHSTTPESELTVKRAIESSQGFLEQIKNDPVYAKTPPQRRKTSVQARLFLYGSERKLLNKPGHKELLAEVQEESRRFDEFILLPEAEYQKAYATVWPRLTDLNRRLESIE